jgi:light-harvesting protein B-800-850 alpha chain
MNNARMWLVVKPTVFIPILFIVMVLASLSVHTSVLLNTTWFKAFLQSGSANSVAAVQAPVSAEQPVVVASR